LTDRYLHIGPVTVTFGTGAIEYAFGVVIRPSATVVEAPDIESACAPLDVRVTNRRLDVYLKVADMTASTMARVLGISQSSIRPDGTIAPSSSDTAVDIGAASVSYIRNDGTAIRWYIKRAGAVPTSAEIPVGKGQFTTADYLLRTLHPQDNTQIPYHYEETASGD